VAAERADLPVMLIDISRVATSRAIATQSAFVTFGLSLALAGYVLVFGADGAVKDTLVAGWAVVVACWVVVPFLCILAYRGTTVAALGLLAVLGFGGRPLFTCTFRPDLCAGEAPDYIVVVLAGGMVASAITLLIACGLVDLASFRDPMLRPGATPARRRRLFTSYRRFTIAFSIPMLFAYALPASIGIAGLASLVVAIAFLDIGEPARWVAIAACIAYTLCWSAAVLAHHVHAGQLAAAAIANYGGAGSVVVLRSFDEDTSRLANLALTPDVVKPRLIGNADASSEMPISTDAVTTFRTVQEAILNPFANIFALRALVDPRGGPGTAYATSLAAENDEWQSVVQGLLATAPFIIVLTGQTPGLQWEYLQLKMREAHLRLFIAFPQQAVGDVLQRWRELVKVFPALEEWEDAAFWDFRRPFGVFIDHGVVRTVIVSEKTNEDAFRIAGALGVLELAAVTGIAPRTDYTGLLRIPAVRSGLDALVAVGACIALSVPVALLAQRHGAAWDDALAFARAHPGPCGSAGQATSKIAQSIYVRTCISQTRAYAAARKKPAHDRKGDGERPKKAGHRRR
jgi:hypothetical protein